MVKSNGSAFEKVTRNMVQNLSEDFLDFRKEIRAEFKDLKKTNAKLYNHLSNRLPPWAVTVGGVGIAVISGLVGAITKGLL